MQYQIGDEVKYLISGNVICKEIKFKFNCLNGICGSVYTFD